MPPKRMSDILPSSSSSLSTHIPATNNNNKTTTISPLPSSQDPTLPLAEDTAQPSNTNSTGDPDSSSKKRKRTPAAPAAVPTPNHPHSSPPTSAKGTGNANTNHPALYTPWLLLPVPQRRELEKEGLGSGNNGVEVLVWTKNQNVRAAVTRVRSVLLGHVDGEGTGAGKRVIAVSAQAAGTVKVVGIVEVVRRVVAASDGGGRGEREGEGEGKGEGKKWWVYTVLSSVVGPRRRRRGVQGVKGGEAEGEEMEIDEGEDGDTAGLQGEEEGEGGAVKASGDEDKDAGAETKVPVLTVWFSRSRLSGWREAFGEEELLVCG